MWFKQTGYKPRPSSGSTPLPADSGAGAGAGSSSSQNARTTAVGGGGTGSTPTPANNVNRGRRRSSDTPFGGLTALKRSERQASFMEQAPGSTSVFGKVWNDIVRGNKGAR